MIRSRTDRWFDRFRRTGDARLLARVFDQTAPELFRVAAHLCRDRHAAEDAVQSTFLLAIEERAQWDAARPVLPWLLGMLANRVRDLRRRAERVIDTTRLTVPQEPDPVQLVSEQEFGATLRQALLRVAEPYRSVVEAHLVHGKTANEIAAELEVPAGTVRMRLHRGLDQLRQKLPASVVAGGVAATLAPDALAAMREVVLAKVPGGTAVVATGSGAAAVSVMGVLLIKKVLLSVALVLALGLSLWGSWPLFAGVEGSPARDVAAEVTSTVRPLAAANESGPSTAPEPGERERAAASSPARAGGRLRVVLHNAGNQQPVAGVTMYVMGGLAQPKPLVAGRASTTADMDLVSRDGRTDADGAATFDLPPGFAQVALRNLASELLFQEVVSDAETELLIELPVQVAADVLVVDGRGQPVVGVSILGDTVLDPMGLVERELGHTGADGHWRCPFVESRVTVRAVAPLHAASSAIELSYLEPTARLQLGENPAVLEGMVVTFAGAPIANTGVLLVPVAWREHEQKPLIVTTDAQGRYECRHVPAGACHVFAWHELENGQRRVAQVQVEAAASQRTVADVRFGRGARLLVSLRNNTGALANQSVALILRVGGLPKHYLGDVADHGQTDAEGRCTIEGIMPGSYELQVPTSLELHRETIELVEGQDYRFERTFDGSSWVELHVVDEAQVPLVGWLVSLRPRGEGMAQQVPVDANGLARFEALARGDYEIAIVSAAGAVACLTRTVASEVRTEIVVPKPSMPTSRVRGTVFTNSAIDFAGLQVDLMSSQHEQGSPPERVAVKVDPASGAFESTPLLAGSYQMIITIGNERLGAMPATIEVPAATVVDMGRIEVGTGSAEFLVTHGDGTPARDAFVAVRFGERKAYARLPWRSSAPTQLPALPASMWSVLVWGRDIAPALMPVTIRNGENTVVPVMAERATPTTFQFVGMAKRGNLMATIRRDGAELVQEVVDASLPCVRGLLPGSYRIECDAGDGLRGAADFAVTAAPGAPTEVRLAR